MDLRIESAFDDRGTGRRGSRIRDSARPIRDLAVQLPGGARLRVRLHQVRERVPISGGDHPERRVGDGGNRRSRGSSDKRRRRRGGLRTERRRRAERGKQCGARGVRLADLRKSKSHESKHRGRPGGLAPREVSGGVVSPYDIDP